MSDLTALVATLLAFVLLAGALAVLGLAALRIGVDSRRSADEDRLGRRTTWI